MANYPHPRSYDALPDGYIYGYQITLRNRTGSNCTTAASVKKFLLAICIKDFMG